MENIEKELQNNIDIRSNIKSATATKVREKNGEERYVVSVPYDSKLEGDVEIFIQSSGLHQLDNFPDYWEESDPNIVGYDTRVKNSGERIKDNSKSEGSVLESKIYYNENGSTISDSNEVELSAEPRTTDVGIQASSYDGVWYPVPSSGDCDNCKAETGVDCAPSRECLGRVASIVGTGIGCGACAYSPSWYNPSCWACVISGFAQGLLGTLDCLGCDEVIDVCITDEFADDYCPYEDDPDPPDCLPSEPCPV